MLQVLLILAIVAGVSVWFVKDEQRRRDAAQREEAMRYNRMPRRTLSFEKRAEVEAPQPYRRPVFSQSEMARFSDLGSARTE